MTNARQVRWADVVTKRDLDVFAERNERDHRALADGVRLEVEVLKQSIEATEHRIIATLRGEMVQQTRTMFFGTVTMLAAFGGLVLAAVRLFG